MSALEATRAHYRSERREGMTRKERFDLALVCAGLAREERTTCAFRILDDYCAEYGRAFELVMREREQYGDTEPPSFAHRSSLLRAARRYRLVVWLLVGLSAAHRITAWRVAMGGCWTRAEARRRAA